MLIDRPGKIIRLERQTPVLEGTPAECGLKFDNGQYAVFAQELNGRGKPTGKMIRIASFAAPELAKKCRDKINAQNFEFQAHIQTDDRRTDWDAIGEPCRRRWEGSVPPQCGPWYVTASMLDQYRRHCGGGLVSYFVDEASADACAEALNKEHPAFEATAEHDDEYKINP
jgi:hypothetical protein